MKEPIHIDFITDKEFRQIMSWYAILQTEGLSNNEDDEIAKRLRKEWSDLIGV